MGLLFLYLAIALVFSFLCSLLEASLLSITPSHASIIKDNNPALSKSLQDFKDNIDKPLAAILTLNTFAHTIGAAGVGAQAQIIWGEEVLTVVSIILTFVILFFTEIIPKTLGANYWQQLTPFTVRTLKILIYSPLYPVIIFSQFITKRLKQEKSKSVLSRADFTAMAELGAKEGVLKNDESRVINNILKFRVITANHIMTPRIVVLAAPEQQKIQEFYDKSPEIRFSRIPVYSENIDNITGFVLKDDILQSLVKGEGEKPLKHLIRPIQVVHENLPLTALFARLMKGKEHIALVADEYGGTAGIVTMEDVIETLIGLEITDEFDTVEDLRKWAIEKGAIRAKRFAEAGLSGSESGQQISGNANL